jgi:hypothetical protein
MSPCVTGSNPVSPTSNKQPLTCGNARSEAFVSPVRVHCVSNPEVTHRDSALGGWGGPCSPCWSWSQSWAARSPPSSSRGHRPRRRVAARGGVRGPRARRLNPLTPLLLPELPAASSLTVTRPTGGRDHVHPDPMHARIHKWKPEPTKGGVPAYKYCSQCSRSKPMEDTHIGAAKDRPGGFESPKRYGQDPGIRPQ